MSANFLSLPSELRNNIYEQLLVLQQPITCPIRFWRRQLIRRAGATSAFTLGLLRANKIIHFEASSILYGKNCFDLECRSSEDVALFLERIGRKNASYILHMNLDFPEFQYLDPTDITIQDDSIGILTKIQSDCINLKTLTLSLSSTDEMEARLDALDYPKIVVEALRLVNARFRAISSLQEIIVEVYEDGPNDHIRREMKKHGWIINETKIDEPLDFESLSFGNFDFDSDYRYYRTDSDYGIEADDYDIDNDSDFWRRAAD